MTDTLLPEGVTLAHPDRLFNSVLTQDADAAYRIARQLRSGGFKQSGIGREGGHEGLHAYLETRTMLLDGIPASL